MSTKKANSSKRGKAAAESSASTDAKKSGGKVSSKDQPKSRSKSWNNRQSRDARRDDRRRDDRNTQLTSLNDFSWYNRYPILTEGVGRVPFPYRPGMDLQTNFNGSTGAHIAIPGVMSYHWLPSVGYSDGTASAVSTVAREIWAKVRREFSSTLEVDPPDFIPYIMALDSVYAYIGALTRIYNVLDWYSANNYAVPNAILVANGLSEDIITALRQNKIAFNFQINTLIKRAAKFTCPFDLDIIKRHYWMNANVYTDAPSINSQMYVFVQDGFYQYALLATGPDRSETDKATGAQLIAAPWAIAASWLDFVSFGEDLLQALETQEDALIMNGYLQRAYGLKPAMTLPEVPFLTDFAAAYEPEVLAQIENSATILSDYRPSDAVNIITLIPNADIWQDPMTNIVYSKPGVSQQVATSSNFFTYADLPVGTISEILSVRSDMPVTQDVIVASRLKSLLRAPYPGEGTVAQVGYPICAGSEIGLAWLYTAISVTNEELTIASQCYVTRGMISLSVGTIAARKAAMALGVLSLASMFDWRPISTAQVIIPTGEGQMNVVLSGLHGDVHNVTTVTDQQLVEMARVCLYSEFNAFSQE